MFDPITRKSKHASLIAIKSQELLRLKTIRYKITYQWRSKELHGPRDDWRSWRDFASIPILFYTKEEAEDYLHSVGNFKNLFHKKKISWTITPVKLKLTKP